MFDQRVFLFRLGGFSLIIFAHSTPEAPDVQIQWVWQCEPEGMLVCSSSNLVDLSSYCKHRQMAGSNIDDTDTVFKMINGSTKVYLQEHHFVRYVTLIL